MIVPTSYIAISLVSYNTELLHFRDGRHAPQEGGLTALPCSAKMIKTARQWRGKIKSTHSHLSNLGNPQYP